jgi:hypothetical protein
MIDDDAQTVNFREICMGRIAPKMLYRSSSPLKGGDLKEIKKELAVNAGINCVINLDDHSSVLDGLSEDVPWYRKLVMEKNVIALPMTFNIPGVEFNEKKLKSALQFMITHEGPYLIHCFAGVDRTGFVSIVLETLLEANLKEIADDYLKSFESIFDSSIYYGTKREKSQVVIKLLSEMDGSNKINDRNLNSIAENYLMNNIKLSVEEVDLLKRKLMGDSIRCYSNSNNTNSAE